MANGLSSKIVDFSKTLPAWQKILAKLAFDITRPITEKDPEIMIALKRFKYDHGLSTELIGQEIINEIDALNVRHSQDIGFTPKLLKINNCKHINAIAFNQSITFSPKLTIIFGENGSGKSGYARLLNSVFYSRGDKKILPNVLKPSVDQGKPEAEFLFKVNNNEIVLKFPSDKDRPEFKYFACFDSKTVNVHLNNSNELYVMPSEMDFFSRLVQLIKIMSDKLKEEAEIRKNQNGFIALLQGDSAIKELIKTLSDKTNFDELKKSIGTSEVISQDLDNVEKEYLDLKHLNPEKRIKEISDIKKQLEDLKSEFNFVLNNYYNQNYLDKVKKIITAVLLAKKENQQSGINSFKTEFLKTIGTESWKKFITSMASLIDEESNILKRKFPISNDHCPLCLQKLQSEALFLFEKYEIFLKGESERALKIAEDNFKQLTFEIDNIQLPSIDTKSKLYSWLDTNHDEEKQKIDKDIKLLSSYKIKIKEIMSNYNAEFLNTIENTVTLEIINKMISLLNIEYLQYDLSPV